MSDPTCTIDGAPTPVDVTASATVNGALANPSGAKVWTVAVVSCDDQNTVAAIAATLVINATAKTFTLTAPAAPGSKVIMQSTVTDPLGNVSSTTFAFNVKSGAGYRVIAPNEEAEQDPVNGWTATLNDVLRLFGTSNAAAGATVFMTASGTTTLSAAQQQIPTLRLSGSATGDMTLAFNGTIGRFLLNCHALALNGHNLTLTNGAGSVVVTTLLSATKTLLTVDCDTPSTLGVG